MGTSLTRRGFFAFGAAVALMVGAPPSVVPVPLPIVPEPDPVLIPEARFNEIDETEVRLVDAVTGKSYPLGLCESYYAYPFNDAPKTYYWGSKSIVQQYTPPRVRVHTINATPDAVGNLCMALEENPQLDLHCSLKILPKGTTFDLVLKNVVLTDISTDYRDRSDYAATLTRLDMRYDAEETKKWMEQERLRSS